MKPILHIHCALAFVLAFQSFGVAQVARQGLIVDPTATRLNPVAGEAIYTNALHNLCFDSDGKQFAVGQGTGRVFVWDIETQKVTQQFQAHDDWAFSVRFLNDGKRILTAGGDNKTKLWSLDDTSKPIKVFSRHTGDVHRVLLTKKEDYIVTAGDDMTPIIESLNDSSKESQDTNPKDGAGDKADYRELAKHPRQIPAMDLSSNERVLATASRDGKIRLFDFASGDELFVLEAHESDCITLRFIPRSMNLVSGGYDGSVAVWNGSMGYLVNRYKKHDGAVVSVDVSPDGSTIASIDNNRLALNSVDNPNQEAILFSPTLASDEQMSCIQFHPSEKLLYATTTLARILVIDREKMSVVKILQTPELQDGGDIPTSDQPIPQADSDNDKQSDND